MTLAEEIFAAMDDHPLACKALDIEMRKRGRVRQAFGCDFTVDVVSNDGDERNAVAFRQWLRGALEEHCAEHAIDTVTSTEPMQAVRDLLAAVESAVAP